MRSLAITNQKGGSCKTTTAVNLAAALGDLGRRVLLIDLDPQASASAWLGVRDELGGLLDIVVDGGKLKDLVMPTRVPNVAIVPASAGLSRAESKAGRGKDKELHLRAAVDRLPASWDFILIDCPPAMGFLSTVALAASNEVLVPVEAHVMALAGLAQLTATVERVHDRMNPELAISGILACRVNRTSHAREVVDRLRERFNGLLLATLIRESTRMAEAPSFQKPINQYAPKSPGAHDYRAAAEEVIARGNGRRSKANGVNK